MYSDLIQGTVRKFVPSVARISYNPIVKVVGDGLSALLALPFSEFRELPPNHLRIRIGPGHRIIANHAAFIQAGNEIWLNFLSKKYCDSRSNIVELGCGCGRLARPLEDEWFQGTFLGMDIDVEMIEYCRAYFPAPKFKFSLSPHVSDTYVSKSQLAGVERADELRVADAGSKDFVYANSLYSHLLVHEVDSYIEETYRILRPGGIMWLTFFCIEHVQLGYKFNFKYRVGEAYIESPRYPRAAVAYQEKFLLDIIQAKGFRDGDVEHLTPNWRQSILVARK